MAVGLMRRSCIGGTVDRVPSRPTGSFVALQTAMREIQRLERAAAVAPNASILELALELADTACFSVSAAEAQYSSARDAYEASFSPLQRRLKRLGTRTRAYHAANVKPRQATLIKARAVFERASQLREKVERSIEPAERAESLSSSEICLPSSTFTELYSIISVHQDFCSKFSDPA